MWFCYVFLSFSILAGSINAKIAEIWAILMDLRWQFVFFFRSFFRAQKWLIKQCQSDLLDIEFLMDLPFGHIIHPSRPSLLLKCLHIPKLSCISFLNYFLIYSFRPVAEYSMAGLNWGPFGQNSDDNLTLLNVNSDRSNSSNSSDFYNYYLVIYTWIAFNKWINAL